MSRPKVLAGGGQYLLLALLSVAFTLGCEFFRPQCYEIHWRPQVTLSAVHRMIFQAMYRCLTFVLHFLRSDVVMGVVCTNDEDLYNQLRFIQNGIGAVPSPFDCFLAHRGLKTLHLRMEAAGRNAHAIALFLESHRGVARVVYPGLPSHPQHALAKQQQHGYGAMITFYCKGGRAQSAIFLQKVS